VKDEEDIAEFICGSDHTDAGRMWVGQPTDGRWPVAEPGYDPRCSGRGEVKGATDGIAPPDVNPETLSKGYRYKPPGEYDPSNPDKWQVSAYFFEPSFVTVVQGDNITLRIFVINGDRHVDWIEAPDGSEATHEEVANRGREYIINFVAEQAGYYILHCDEHEPTMRMTLLSLPSNG